MCPNCKHILAWYDLLPLFSWLSLKGKCRYCKKPISAQYPLVELLTALLLVGSYHFWPYSLASDVSYLIFALWGGLLVLLVSLCVYDLRWLELPTSIVYAVFGLSAASVAILAWQEHSLAALLSALLGSALLGGLFWLLYQVSNGKWIGGGDVRLGFAMGLYLGWQQGILALSLAAYIGTIIVLIMVILGKYHRRMKLPFGPLLIAGWVLSLLFGQAIIDWYLRLIGVA